MYYARIDENSKCYGIFGTNKKETSPDLIELEGNEDVLGKTWNGVEWIGEGFIFTEPEEPKLLEAEIIQAEILLNQQEILNNQQNQDEALAMILLMQTGGI